MRPPPAMWLTAFGAVAAATMVLSYGLEPRGPRWIAVFAAGCAATAVYAVLSGAWIFAVLETIWAALAVVRFRQHRTTGVGFNTAR